jgi:hypothetical protein
MRHLTSDNYGAGGKENHRERSQDCSSFAASSADVEVPAKAQRRIFTAEEKKRILEETDPALANGGGVGAILRR